MACPVCGFPGDYPLEAGKRRFKRCKQCAFIQAQTFPTEEEARRRYELHDNGAGNEGYSRFLSSVIEKALAAAPGARSVLDWGSGPNPLAVDLLRQRGFSVTGWDPFFASENEPLEAAYDLILCIETAEHFFDPQKEFRRISQSLKQDGLAVLHTHLAPLDDSTFSTWWYKEDFTHVSFYTEESLRFLAEDAGLSVDRIEERKLVFLKKGH
jgi:SAM-dependent methyltransferase